MAQWGWRVVMGNAAHPIRLRPEHSVLRQHHLEKTVPQPHTTVTGHASAEVEENTIFFGRLIVWERSLARPAELPPVILNSLRYILVRGFARGLLSLPTNPQCRLCPIMIIPSNPDATPPVSPSYRRTTRTKLQNSTTRVRRRSFIPQMVSDSQSMKRRGARIRRL
jgi:hypothetical protein